MVPLFYASFVCISVIATMPFCLVIICLPPFLRRLENHSWLWYFLGTFVYTSINDWKDMTNHLWLNKNNTNLENNVRVNKFWRVHFRIVSSPFLLPTTLKCDLIAMKIREAIYVDNVKTATVCVNDSFAFCKEAEHIFQNVTICPTIQVLCGLPSKSHIARITDKNTSSRIVCESWQSVIIF